MWLKPQAKRAEVGRGRLGADPDKVRGGRRDIVCVGRKCREPGNQRDRIR
jgi:hypothetical protein